jgi:two-component system, NarL family, sensor histidine kinase DesK
LRLLPKSARRDLGFTAYLWLVYAVPFLADPFLHRDPPLERLATVAGGLVFLALYFAGFWAAGRRLLAVIAGLVLLGTVFAPWNTGAVPFFIYAGAHCGRLVPPRSALGALAGVIAVAALTAWALRLPPGFALASVVLTAVVGGVNVHFAERGRQDQRLRLAQHEIERLAQLAERERIARDLHDLLGHTLSIIVLKSELAAKLAERDPVRAVAEIRDVERISREALQEVRAAVTGYRAGVAEEVLKAGEALRAAGIAFEPAVDDVRLSPAQEGVLALAIREAVTNVVRHAGARACHLRLARTGRTVDLRIEDDGAGGASAEGFGLRAMRERVTAQGGSITRDGREGMRIHIVLPVATEAS